MPTRYIYQNKEIKFLENTATVERALGGVGTGFVVGPPEQEPQPYCCLKSEEGIVTISELTPFSLLLKNGVTQEQIDDQLAAQENPIKKRKTTEMHSKVEEFQKLHPSPLSSASSIIALTEQISNPILLAAIRKNLKVIPREIREEVNRTAGESFAKAMATGKSLGLPEIKELITKAAEEIQSKTKVIEEGVDASPERPKSPAL
ncbi:MAG: hypothetical protein ACD_21C00182G0001 [uncultured bacterium]|nr:MAG: hypothetical protein ACD_21C00182G0001 [uncultured bacterium]